MKDIFEFARKTIKETNTKDKNNMPIIYNQFSDEEKIFVDNLMKKLEQYKNDIIYNEKSGCINFCYKNMQIGRIRLNNSKRKMQILTLNKVYWIYNITLDESIKNIDMWINYLEKIKDN